MKSIIKHLILLLTLLLFQFCKNENTFEKSHYDLNPKQIENRTHVTEGIWINIPVEYKKAKSYKGYQTADNWSSISVKLSAIPIEYLKTEYSLDKLKAKNRELLEISTVKYGENENAFFVVIHDKLKSTINYLLAIKESQKRTFLIKGWSFYGAKDLYDDTIRKAILSTYIGDKINEDVLFKLAENNLGKSLVFTKDSLNPTLHHDKSTIEVTLNPETNGLDKVEFIKDQIEKLTGIKNVSVKDEQFNSGSSYHNAKGVGNKNKAIIGLVQESNGNITFIKAHGNLDSSLEEFEEFIKLTFFKTVVTPNGRRKLF